MRGHKMFLCKTQIRTIHLQLRMLQVSKVEKWAEKVNSEMQDIENFELSVEG